MDRKARDDEEEGGGAGGRRERLGPEATAAEAKRILSRLVKL